MNSQKFFLMTISIILCSCSSQSQSPATSQKTQEPISAQPQQSAKLPEKAEKVCGDSPPTDPKVYPVRFYPVSVEYSDKNLELVKKHFCEDARETPSKSLGKNILQAASFTSKDKAEAFKEKLSQYFSQARVGEPTIVEQLKSDMNDRKSAHDNLDTVESIAKSALLNSDQVKQLLDLEESRKFYSKGSDRSREIGKVKVLVPTYIPSGFSLAEFSRISLNPKSEYDMRYRLRYKSSNGESFDIANFEMLGDAPAFMCDFGRLDHPLLGQIRLWYSSPDRAGKNTELSFQVPYILFYQGQPTGYYFYSGERQGIGIGKMISREEAIKIINSLKPLNPKTRFDSVPATNRWDTISEDLKKICSNQ